MIFATVPLDHAEGALLAHSRRVDGRMLKKGTLLDAAAIEALRAAGITGYVKRRKVRTTVPEPADRKVPDLLKRDFTATAPMTRPWRRTGSAMNSPGRPVVMPTP